MVMKLIAGVDIGNSTTEVCIGKWNKKALEFVGDSSVKTTGIKGTVANVRGILSALQKATEQTGYKVKDLDLIRINQAAPVIGDTAMETITETIITESTMVGHNPDTPAGMGLAIGITLKLPSLEKKRLEPNDSNGYLIIIDKQYTYEEASQRINRVIKQGVSVQGLILQEDEAVLVHNRLDHKVPIVDEVAYIEKIPEGVLGAIEVAKEGNVLETLSNPYGIATIFNLDPEQTKQVVPIAKSLVGKRSAIVLKTPDGSVKEKVIKAGTLYFNQEESSHFISVEEGSNPIMKLFESIQPVADVKGETGTHVGNMFTRMREHMATLTQRKIDDIKIRDILAVDTLLPLGVTGAVAGEVSMENGVALAAMVKTGQLPLQDISKEIEKQLGIKVEIAGVEAVMAAIGALTTPGTTLPIGVLDLGGGSSDIAVLRRDGKVISEHLAGAGQLVTMLINSELGLNDMGIAEKIKRYPVAKVRSLYHIQLESGGVKFFDEPLPPKLFGRVIILEEDSLVPIQKELTLEQIRHVRRLVKEKVFVTNSLRALERMNEMETVPNIVVVGGSAIDTEISELLMEQFSRKGIVAGKGNIRGTLGPRGAVATGLVMSYGGDM